MSKMSAGKGVFYLRRPWLQIKGQRVSLKSVPSVEEEKEMAFHAFVKVAGEDTMKKHWEVICNVWVTTRNHFNCRQYMG